jgi:hypothetical protein
MINDSLIQNYIVARYGLHFRMMISYKNQNSCSPVALPAKAEIHGFGNENISVLPFLLE